MSTLASSTSTTITTQRIDAALLVLRIVAGTIFIAHGAQKIFVYGLPGVSGSFAQMGVPLPGVMGPLIAGLEFFGGIALILGVLTRLVAAGLAMDMLGAMFLVHLKAGFFLPNGYEFTLALFGMAAALVIAGGGRWSLDDVVVRRRSNSSL